MTQLARLHAHLYRRDGPNTSRKAAFIAPGFIPDHEQNILAVLHCEVGKRGLTYREIAAYTYCRLEPVAVGRRLRGMERNKLIRRDGERNGMTVWKAA